MKKITILSIYLFALSLVISAPVRSQTLTERVNILDEKVTKHSNTVSVSMNFVLDNMKVKRNEMIILTPILRSNENGLDSISLPPAVISGGLRNKILKRKNSLGDELPFAETPQSITERKNNKAQTVAYTAAVPYRAWMADASLSVTKTISGCANCSDIEGDQLISQTILPHPIAPTYQLTYIMPEVEPVKNRSERHTATFNYIVDKYELLRDYKGNASELAQVDKIISNVQGNDDLQITEFSVEGYASPEGSYEHNRKLSENRANSFANYLESKFGVGRNKFSVKGYGEDWLGLRKAVAAATIADKQAILNIIDNTNSPDTRDAELIKLSDGETYRMLLSHYYPPLRRTEYAIAYTVRAFSVEEARKIIKTNPKLLSLNEMYLVAQSYPSDSKEFKEVFDIAVRLYPESDIAIVNSAAADIEAKNLDAAIERMKRIEAKPEVWNNLGVAYILKGDAATAKTYFENAVAKGNIDAANNLKKMQEVTQEEE